MTKRNYDSDEQLWLDKFSPKDIDNLPISYKNFFIECNLPITREAVNNLCLSEMYLMNLKEKHKTVK